MKGKQLKKLLAVLVSAVLALGLFGLVACGSDKPAGTAATEGTVTLVVGATPAPHAEILASVAEDLAAEGITLDVIEYTDYVKPNMDTAAGDIQVNFFQHEPYLDEFNAENDTDLVSVAAIHFEPLAIYPGKTKAIADLPDGAVVAVPSDTTNEARALHLLAAEGLITLPSDADLSITPKDIVANPKNLEFLELEAAAIPPALADVDIAVINGNYALAANLDTGNVLASEDSDSEAAKTYANIIVVNPEDETDTKVQALIAALTSDKTRDFINDTYKGVVVPVF